MRCTVCGEEGLVHECAGPPLPAIPSSESSRRPQTSLPNYFREGLAIASLDLGAIRRAAGDPKAFRYGCLLLGLAYLPTFVWELRDTLWPPRVMNWAVLAFAWPIATSALVAALLVYFGVFHACARFVFGGKGKYRELVRPMLLSSPLLAFLSVPLLGDLLAIWWSFSVLAWVAGAVHSVGRLRMRILILFMGLVLFLFLLGLLRLANALLGI